LYELVLENLIEVTRKLLSDLAVWGLKPY